MIPERDDGRQEKEALPSIDVIVVHGSGLHRNVVSKDIAGVSEEHEIGLRDWLPSKPECPLPKISWDARMRLTAAGYLWEKYHIMGIDLPVVVAGGRNYPTLAPSIAEVMKADLINRFQIPRDKIILVDKGGNTVTDNEGVIEIMRTRGFMQAIDISSGYHKVEEYLAERRGAKFVSSETLLKERYAGRGHESFLRIIDDLCENEVVNGLVRSQKMRVIFLKIPFVGGKIYEKDSVRRLRELEPGSGAKVTNFDKHGLKKMLGRSS